jgi:hypothetical protein
MVGAQCDIDDVADQDLEVMDQAERRPAELGVPLVERDGAVVIATGCR